MTLRGERWMSGPPIHHYTNSAESFQVWHQRVFTCNSWPNDLSFFYSVCGATQVAYSGFIRTISLKTSGLVWLKMMPWDRWEWTKNSKVVGWKTKTSEKMLKSSIDLRETADSAVNYLLVRHCELPISFTLHSHLISC